MVGRTEHRIHLEECNRVDWRSTLRYAAAAKRRWERDIVRLLTLRKWVGTAFGTARLVELALSADGALLFPCVRPFHHGGDGEAVWLVGLHFVGALGSGRGMGGQVSTPCRADFRPRSTRHSPRARKPALRHKPELISQAQAADAG
jgi:hypothetical protein